MGENARCEWCGEPAVRKREIVPAGGKRVWPLKVPVCEQHSQMIDRNIRERDVERARNAAKRVRR